MPEEPFDIRLQLRTDEGGCPSDTCSDYPMDCGGVVSVRVVEAEFPATPDAATGDAGPPIEPALASRCETFTGQDLCSLADIDIGFQDLPAEMVRIQVAVWAEGQLEDDACPQENIFNVNPVGGTNYEPAPAVAGWGYFDLSEIDVAEIPLTCPNPEQLASCTDETTLVNVNVQNVETLVFVDDELGESLNVSIAEPGTRENPNTGELEYLIEPSDTFSLQRSPDSPFALWFGEVETQFDNTACVQVLENAPQATAAVVCQPTSPGAPIATNCPMSCGQFVSKELLDEILTADGQVLFPTRGLVLGRVIDHQGVPLADVKVTPMVDAPDDEVRYLSDDRNSVGGTRTSSNGYFIAPSVPFGTRWIAEHVDGRRQDGEYRAGLLVGKITVVVIQMGAPVLE